jgi:flavin reductase
MDSEKEIITQFKQAMRRLASTPTLITGSHAGKRLGLAATAVTSLSATSPSLLMCINRNASMHAYLKVGVHICVNILQSYHTGLCSAFGGKLPPEERFGVGSWGDCEGIPYLQDAAANLFCTISAMIDHESHTIIIGAVDQIMLSESNSPLIFGEGRYHHLGSAI